MTPLPLLILTMIQAAMSGLSQLKGSAGTDAQMGMAFTGIIQNGMAAYHAATGQPLDITKIPLETPVASLPTPGAPTPISQ